MTNSSKNSIIFFLGFLCPTRFFLILFRETWTECLAVNAFGVPAEDLTKEDLSLARKIGEFYFGEGDQLDEEIITLESKFENITNFFTDAVFAHGSDLMVK